VLMTIILGGAMVPATSLVMEKVKRTLPALGVSPATLMDVLASKGLMGVLISLTGGLLILFLNRAFGGSPLLLVFVLTLGAIFSAAVGMIFGALVRDMNTLMTVIKSTGILLYAPAFVYMFPELPQWIGRLFPTYYIIEPVLEITQNNAGLADIALDLVILVGLIVVTLVVAAQLAARMQATEAAA
jgi:ABC-2 type transport system permease protein